MRPTTILILAILLSCCATLGDCRLEPSLPSSPSRRPQSKMVASLKNGLASGLSAGCVKLVLAPFDTVKTLQQHSRSLDGEKALTLGAAARELLKRGGVGELYSGVAVTVLGSMPSVGLYFGVYHFCKKKGAEYLERNDAASAPLAKTANIALAAAIGNTVASFTRVPYEVVKQKLQTGQYPSTLSAITSMYAAEGFQAFFPKGGVAVQMIRDIPYAVYTLMAYEWFQANWAQQGNGRGQEVPRWKNMVCGAAAGGIGSLFTNPMDVVKTRIQTNPSQFMGIMHCARATLQDEGAAAFMKGSVPRLMHKVPANGLFFVCYEFFRLLLRVEPVAGLESEKKSLKIKSTS
eukprot:CAMPEP_0197563940 /NCGR_PEP_ID=MMETSP1320-20131121/29584_1 /TAXON_ID=91990 /ORGANISM="Bolidomonas sp., Strain RCC2347" /LENGTH=347 /DNA_ID=CAMNT_0043125815 /DNA_START=45 /DNA_END=1088 /DNA_ORIENTATION=-